MDRRRVWLSSGQGRAGWATAPGVMSISRKFSLAVSIRRLRRALRISQASAPLAGGAAQVSVSSPQRGAAPRRLLRELGSLLLLALPLMGAQIAQMGLGVIDTVFAGHLSPQDLAGVALGSSLFWPMLLLLWGIPMALTPSVAQMHGRGEVGQSGELARQALWISLGCSALYIGALDSTAPLFLFLGVEEPTAVLAADYLRALSWGVPGMLGYVVLRNVVEGLGNTRPGLVVACAALVIKLPLAYGLVYGAWGLPKLGGVGCGVSTALVMWFECFCMLIYYLFRPGYRRVTGLFSRFSWPHLGRIRNLLRLAIPMGLTIFLEVTIFSGTGLLLGRFGANVVAAHQIALNVGGVIFMIPVALGIASSIRVGYHVGGGAFDRAHLTGIAALAGACLYAGLCLVILMVVRDSIAFLYTGGNSQEVADLVSILLIFVAMMQFFDATQAVALGILRGYKDARAALLITFSSLWLIALPLGIGLGYGLLTDRLVGAYGFWTAMVTGLLILSVGAILRFLWLAKQKDRITRLAGT